LAGRQEPKHAEKQLSARLGGPLRLVIPVKYGIERIKRLDPITFAEIQAEGYWPKRGYDWFAGSKPNE
jgi:DMSO/TMAO reductase YedYZ molybdopterin-dependent catalytic subunit